MHGSPQQTVIQKHDDKHWARNVRRSTQVLGTRKRRRYRLYHTARKPNTEERDRHKMARSQLSNEAAVFSNDNDAETQADVYKKVRYCTLD